MTFTDADLNGADVVGDTVNQYFYVVEAVDFLGNHSAVSNRVGEYDYRIVVTATSDFNLVGVPFANTGLSTADDLIAAIGSGNVNTVNNYVAAFAELRGPLRRRIRDEFCSCPGWAFIRSMPRPPRSFRWPAACRMQGRSVTRSSLPARPTSNYIMVPFDREGDFATASDVITNIPGVLNTLNNFLPSSQSYESWFAAGFGSNFVIRAGKPYQANAAAAGTFPNP